MALSFLMRAAKSNHRPPRRPYRNGAGDSPIEAFEIGRDYVRIWFHSQRAPYRYGTHVAELARRARAGRGLATFISRHRDELPFERG